MKESLFKRIARSLTLLLLLVNPSFAADEKTAYLSGIWFQRAENLNLLTAADGRRIAVDNDGKHIADDSLAPQNRNFKMFMDTLFEHEGIYYLARDLGNHGYEYIPIGSRENLLTGAQISEKQRWEQEHWQVSGHLLDPDPMRGDCGMALFPDAKLAIWCGQSQWDSRGFGVFPYGPPKKKPDYDIETFPLYSGAGSSVKTEDFPDRVFVDHAGKGFWYLGGKDAGNGRQLVLAFVTPVSNADGKPDLKLGKQVPVGDFGKEQFEAGVVIGDQLFLLLAKKNPSIGGVDPQRRLLRVNRADGELAETPINFNCYLDDVRLASMGKLLAIHSPDELALIDGSSLGEKWRKPVAQLLENGEGHRIYRVSGSRTGDRLAVGLATPYRKPGEMTHVLMLDPSGKSLARHALKPGSLDELVFTDDGGLLVFSAQYTAKIGGTVDVLANEAEAIAKAKSANPQVAASDQAPPRPCAFLDTPLQDRHTIWFDAPAKGFGGEALPLGNGHLGAMFDGRTDTPRIVLSVDSMWEGSETNFASYQGFAEIGLALNHDPKKIQNYRRELDFRTGLYNVTYTYEGTTYKREAFCSFPHGLLAVRFTADKPGAYTGDVELMAMHKSAFKKGKDGIEFAGSLKNGRKYNAVIRLETGGGKVIPEAGKDGERVVTWRRYTSTRPYNSVRVEGADSITLYVAGDTDYSLNPADNFRGQTPEAKIAPRLAHIGKKSFEEMREESAKDVAALFDRCTLELATNNPEAESLPVNARKRDYSGGAMDPGLETLAFDAQRYMIIACSRPGSLPANLQGIWNNSNWPDWTCDYHTDINIQMNYWFVEPANLAECARPMFDYFDSQIPIWRKQAKQTFGDSTRGWTVAYMNNIDGGMAYKNFPPGSAWLAWHVAEHFKFNQDENFLREYAYPMLKELSEHWQDLLIKRPDGLLTTPRTMSPEHKPPQYGISQDVQIVHNLFTDYLAASKRLNADETFRKEVTDLRGRLLPIKIGRWGQIQEWERDRDSRYCNHRHIQHLFAAFPGSQIGVDTPELAEAAITSLEARGMGSTGWSQAWRINIFARLGRADLVERQLRSTLRGLHEHLIWQGKQQIDAPCGYAAGVCEALLQSHVPLDDKDSQFEVHLLPALPPAWQAGRVKGLRARGGLTVDIEWKDGKVTDFTIRSPEPRQVRVRLNGETRTVQGG
jgi:alpha-L-fucosidase 2